MKYYKLAVLVSAIALIGQQPIVASIGDEAIAEIAEATTVMIASQNSGSGAIVDKQGDTYTVLTAKHVVQNPDQYFIVAPDEQEYQLDHSTVNSLPDVDLALVRFTSSQTYRVAKLGNSDRIQLGTSVYVAGWRHAEPPIETVLLRFVGGSIAARPPRPLPEGYQLIYTNVTGFGMSGGPILNEEGELIGIHGQKEGREVFLPNYETITDETNFNLGIPINTFLKVSAHSQPEMPNLPEPPSSPTSSEDMTVFKAAPRLESYRTTINKSGVRGATYYFTLSLPNDAEVPLQQLVLEQRQGVEFPEKFVIRETRAFEGTQSNRGEEISLDLVAADRENRTITVTFDPPIQPGTTATIGLRPVRNPRDGVYIFRVIAYPLGDSAVGMNLGNARLQFYREDVFLPRLLAGALEQLTAHSLWWRS